MKYLQEMLKYSKGCDGCHDLQEALSSILGILKAVNDSMHLIAITGYEVSKMYSETEAVMMLGGLIRDEMTQEKHKCHVFGWYPFRSNVFSFI